MFCVLKIRWRKSVLNSHLVFSLSHLMCCHCSHCMCWNYRYVHVWQMDPHFSPSACRFCSCWVMLNLKKSNGQRETNNTNNKFCQEQCVLNKSNSFCSLSYLFVEKLASAKEENLGMHQVLDQTLQELNSIWKIGKFHLPTFHKWLHSSYWSVWISQRINLICFFFITLWEYPMS